MIKETEVTGVEELKDVTMGITVATATTIIVVTVATVIFKRDSSVRSDSNNLQ